MSNISYEKCVAVRYMVDNWITISEACARCVGPFAPAQAAPTSDDGEWDRFAAAAAAATVAVAAVAAAEQHDKNGHQTAGHLPDKTVCVSAPSVIFNQPLVTLSTQSSCAKQSLLERPENHHMICWDLVGEHIIVE
jgi:hypothetical protein